MDTRHSTLAMRAITLIVDSVIRLRLRPKMPAQPGVASFLSSGKVLATALAILFVLPSYKVVATQLTLSQSPLYLSVPVEPNVMHLLDDSGSMEWELMVSSANGGNSNGLPTIGGWAGNYYMLPSANNGLDLGYLPYHPYVVPSESEVTGAWVARNASFNALYYNPAVTYEPWPGSDTSGNLLYTSATATAASVNPNSSAAGTLNLTSNISFWNYATSKGGWFYDTIYPAHYYTWTDSDGDGVVDTTDTHTLVQIISTTPSYPKASTRSDCAGSTCTYAEEIQNFANWYVYYRKRSYVGKNAIGSLINGTSGIRYGLQIYNGGLVSNATAMTTSTKVSLLQDLYTLDIPCTDSDCPGTPARPALKSVGDLFEGASTPILSAASGGTCQQNFVIMVTDGFWNGASPSLPGDGNTDADGNSPNSAGNTTFDGGAYADTYANTLADVAMHYYERDLASTLSDQVPVTLGADTNSKQHLVTYGVAFGVSGTLSAGPTSATQSFTWPDPTDTQDAERIDDLRHAAYNGRGEFLSAQNPADLSSALLNALASISDRTGSSAAVAANSVALNTSSAIYQARFTSGEWLGDLRIFEIDSDGSVSTLLASAKSTLAAQHWNTGRVILASNDSQGIPFRWTTSGANTLTATLQSNLNTDPATSTVDNQGSDRLEWLRGNATHEGTGNNYRERSGYKLGDIVNADPVFVGAPPFLPETETSLHSTFRSTHINRRKMVYVGANDGMLHGFDATTAQEKIAYVPSMVSTSLNKLTNPNYTHQYYVDGSPAYGDAYDTFSNSCSSVACWRTLLVSGLGGGGKGLFALDITDPDGSNITNLQFQESNAANIVLWEWNGTAANASAKGYNTSDLGYIYGKATVARMQDGEWVVIFGNGYNSTRERAILYIVRARDGVVIKSIDFSGADNTSNGLSSPAVVDVDGDNKVDYIYAGDLRGNLWKADVDSASTSTWKTAYGTTGSPDPLFVAVDASNVSQPITSRPTVGQHPDSLTGYMVYFGTGRYLVSGDQTPASSPVHTFYGVWDKNDNSGNTPVERADLLPQTMSTTTVGGYDARTITNTTIQWRTGNSGTCQSDGSGTCLGWRDDFLTASTGTLGEMMVTNPKLTGTDALPAVSLTTLIPSNDACTAGGTGLYILLNPKNGGPLSQAVIDINQDGVIDSNDLANGSVIAGFDPNMGILSDPLNIYGRGGVTSTPLSGSRGGVESIHSYFPYGTLGRQSWRQLK